MSVISQIRKFNKLKYNSIPILHRQCVKKYYVFLFEKTFRQPRKKCGSRSDSFFKLSDLDPHCLSCSFCYVEFALNSYTILTLKVSIATKVVCFSRLLKCLRSLYGKQCGPRTDCSYIGAVCSGSTLFASILNLSVMLGNNLQQTTYSDAFFSWRFKGIYYCLIEVIKG